MSLNGVLGQADSGLSSIQQRLATISQNISNASTPGYVRETVPTSSVDAGGVAEGVRTGVASRTVDGALQATVFSAGATVADGQARQASLSAVDQLSGAPGSGQDLGSLLGALRDAFSTLANDPSNETQQRRVVNQADTLARGINQLGSGLTGQRQAVQESLVSDVANANAALATVGSLSLQIIAARARGDSTAGLEDKRDTAAALVASLTGAQFVPQSNGDLLAVSGGTVLPTHAASGPLSIGAATVAPGFAGPALTIGGLPVNLGSGSGSSGGGRIGAELDLRDTVLPGIQSGLDAFAQALAGGFAGSGLTLFTDSAGAVPAAGTAGFAQEIQVSAAVVATPSQVRDGAAAAAAAGSTTLIDAVLGGVLATGSGTVADQAAGLVAGIATQSSDAQSRLSTDQAVQTSLQTKLAAQTGVSVDQEMTAMVALQNSYGANAKVISAVQTMWTQLLGMLQ